ATGSFQSSMETLAGDNDLEIAATGGVPEKIAGEIASLPYALRISPRVEDYAIVAESKQSVPLVGLDLVGESDDRGDVNLGVKLERPEDMLKYLDDYDGVWVGESLKRSAGERVDLIVNDRPHEYVIRGTFPDSG